MISKDTSFARYSKPLSWIVSVISLILAFLAFIGDGNNPALTAILWLGLAIAFAIAATSFGKASSGDSSDSPSSD